MNRINRTLIIVLASLLIPGLIQAQLAYEPVDLMNESEVKVKYFTSPSPINIKEVQNAIQYPENAQDAGLEGLVICKILVDKDGNYMRHRVVHSPDPSLREAVSPHLARLRFVPAIKNGEAVAAWTTLRFAFRLTEDFSTPKPDRDMQAQIWEQSAQAQMDAGQYAYALELFENAIALQNNVPNELVEKAAFAALSARDYVQARVHLTNLLHQSKSKTEKARILYLRAQSADLQEHTALAASDRERLKRFMPEFAASEEDKAFFASLNAQ